MPHSIIFLLVVVVVLDDTFSPISGHKWNSIKINNVYITINKRLLL